jgi:DNA polymerase III subunit epsilon
MSLLSRLFSACERGAAPPRWIVLDVETTGLDMQHDRLLAIAAVALHFDGGGVGTPRIALADSFEAVLRHDSASTDKDNILLHGIGVGAQRSGQAPAEVLGQFERWVGAAPLIAFHAAFDRAMIGRASQQHLGRALRNPWLDLAPVASGLHPAVRARALDDWLLHYGIECAQRHQAAADTLATAELLLRLWPAARAQGCASFEALAGLARQQRWLAPASASSS